MLLRRLLPLFVLLAGAALPATAQASTSPSLVGSVASSTSLAATVSVAVSGNYAYTTAYHAGELTAVNISNPSAPMIAGSTAPTTDLYGGSNVAISGGYAFVVSKNRNASTSSNDDGTGNSMTIVDIHTDPANPSVVGTVRSPSQLFGSYGIAVSGHYAYVAYQGLLGGQPASPDTSTGGFTVIDITNPHGPAIVANLDNGALPAPYTGSNALDHSTSVAISGNYAYVDAFNNASVTVIDISTPTSPHIVYTLKDNTQLAFPADLAIQGTHLYAADQTTGTSDQLTVIDISAPTSPHIVGVLSNSALGGAYRIRASGNFVYISGSSANAIGVVDVSNPSAPVLAGSVTDTTHLHRTTGLDLTADGQYVVASSPYLSTESNVTYPPYPLSGGGFNTGTISVIRLDANNTAPSISGTAALGQTLTASPGSWSDASPSFTYKWNRCDQSGANCTPISGATGSTYAPQRADVGATITLTVTATDNITVATAGSSATAPVSGNPSNTSLPSIGGQLVTGQTLTAQPGSWSAYPSPSYTYQWVKCDSTGNNCAPNGATGQTYTLQPGDANSTFEVTVTADNGIAPAGSATSSPPTATVGAPPASTNPPSISGTASQGQTLSVSGDTWSGTPTPSVTYAWQRCDSSGANCFTIASGPSYVVSSSDVGSTLSVLATASNTWGNAQRSSSVTGVVTGPPANTSRPTVSGTAAQGQTLTAVIGSWNGYPLPSFTYQWYRCNQSGSSCSALSGASGSSYVLGRGDVATTLRVTVRGTNPYGTATATSLPTPVVTGPPANTSAPTQSGSAVQGSQLTGTTGTWTGYPTPSLSAWWVRCGTTGDSCTAISGATGLTYTIGSADVGHTLRLYVRGTNSSGSYLARSSQTAVVTAAAGATFSGLLSGHPSLKVKARGPKSSWLIRSVTVNLPSGLSTASASQLKRRLTVKNGAGRAVAFKLKTSAGRLVITLLKPTSSVQIALPAGSLGETARLSRSLKQHKLKRLSITVVLVSSRGRRIQSVLHPPVH